MAMPGGWHVPVPEQAPDPTDIAVVRRPIADGDGGVVGYELVVNGEDAATTAGLLLDAFGDIGLERLTGRHPAWLPMTAEFLLAVGAPPVQPDRVVLQIAGAPASDELLTALSD